MDLSYARTAAGRRTLGLIAALVIVCAGGTVAWSSAHHADAVAELVLYGNVDLRQVDLAFNSNERIAAVLVQEGERVHGGQVVARLDVDRLTPQADEAQAAALAQGHVLSRLRNGSRAEEIAQASANIAAAQAEVVNAREHYGR